MASSTLSDLSAQAHRNNSYDTLGRTLATTDSLEIDNQFVVAARAPTIEALPGYFRYLLLPRREIDARLAKYVLCYAGDTRSLGRRVTWVLSEPGGLEIGRAAG